MANYSIKADLLKVKGAFVKDLKGRTGAVTEEERNSTPILGGMHEIKASPKPIDTSAVVVDDDDLPF